MSLIEKILDPDATPSLTSILSAVAAISGLIVGFIGAFMGKPEVVGYCQFLVGGGFTAKILQTGTRLASKGKK